MGMRHYIDALVEPDKKRYDAMTQIYQQCVALDIEVPEEVQEFFNWEEPGAYPEGTWERIKGSNKVRPEDQEEDGCVLFCVDIEDLPKGTKKIRVRYFDVF